MPRKPKRPCRYPGCPNLSRQGRVLFQVHMQPCLHPGECAAAHARGYGSQLAHRPAHGFLRSATRCARSAWSTACFTPATVVDHVIPHRGDQEAVLG